MLEVNPNRTKFTNAYTGVAYYFNDDFNGFKTIDPKVNNRTVTDRYKLQEHGAYPTFPARGVMTIDIVGDLIADDSADYIVKRKAMVAALFGSPTTAITQKKNGRLTVRWAGDTEDSYCDVIVMEFSAPITANPGYTEYMITFCSFAPYWTYASSGTKYFFS